MVSTPHLTITVARRRIDRLCQNELARWQASNVGFVLLPMLSARHNVELPLLLTELATTTRRRNAEIALQLVELVEIGI